MDLDGWSLIWFVVPGIIVPAALLVLAFRSPSWKQMTRWATQAQVTITTENEDMIRRRLARARRYRSLVSFPFWWVLAVPVITGPLPEWANDVIWIPLTGYVLGSILAGFIEVRIHDDQAIDVANQSTLLGDWTNALQRCDDFLECEVKKIPGCENHRVSRTA